MVVRLNDLATERLGETSQSCVMADFMMGAVRLFTGSDPGKVDGFGKSHQRAPGGAPELMTGIVSH